MQSKDEFRSLMERVDSLVHKFQTISDPELNASARELVESLLELYGTGLDRMMEIVSESPEAAPLFEQFARDELVSNLLLLHGLHPEDLSERVAKALDKVRPYLKSHGGNVELAGINDGVVQLRMQGSCHGCPSSAMTLKLAIEEAIYEAAPDVVSISVEGVVQQPAPAFFPADKLLPEKPVETQFWKEVQGVDTLGQGSVRTVEVNGRSLLLCRIGESLYAYGNRCPGCGSTLQEAYLEAAALVCPNCSLHYDAMRAGRGLDQPALNLEPFPLLIEQGRAKVALPP